MDDRPEIGDNLFTPVPGDHGAHGDFDGKAHAHSPETWLSEHQRGVLSGVGAVAVGAVALHWARAST
ncbi:MAG: short-chain dehydrogenase/reductase [Mycobacterium sp.]|nr:short-chain dehydrogenase/reductase [Mycobacterium sp.]